MDTEFLGASIARRALPVPTPTAADDELAPRVASSAGVRARRGPPVHAHTLGDVWRAIHAVAACMCPCPSLQPPIRSRERHPKLLQNTQTTKTELAKTKKLRETSIGRGARAAISIGARCVRAFAATRPIALLAAAASPRAAPRIVSRPRARNEGAD